MRCLIFFFNDTATTEIYTLSLHDALPIFADPRLPFELLRRQVRHVPNLPSQQLDRKSTRLNSSHQIISYAVFCLKKKKKKKYNRITHQPNSSGTSNDYTL